MQNKLIRQVFSIRLGLINYQKQKSKMVSKRIGGFEISQLGSRVEIPCVDRMDIP